MTLTKSEAARIRKYFQDSSWKMDGSAVAWYWLPIARRAMFRCECKSAKPIPRGAIFIGVYDRFHSKDFLDDLQDAIALAAARRATV